MTSEAWIDTFGDAEPPRLPPGAVRPAHPTVDAPTAADLDLPRRMGGLDPRVSVIIPTYRDAAYLSDALRSVGAQHMDDLEVVIVDSGGVDWIDALANDRRWITHLPSEPNGVGAARNDGLDVASGTFVAFLDADDYWHPAKLERQLEAMGPARSTCFTGYHFVNYWTDTVPEITMRDVRRRSGDVAVSILRRTTDAHMSTLCCRARIVPDRPFLEDLNNFEDVAFTIDRFRTAPPVHVSDPLVVRRLRPDSLADRTDPIEKAASRIDAVERLIDRHPTYSIPGRRTIAEERYRIARLELDRGNASEARTQIRRAIRSHPEPTKVALAYVLSTVPGDHLERFGRTSDTIRRHLPT